MSGLDYRGEVQAGEDSGAGSGQCPKTPRLTSRLRPPSSCVDSPTPPHLLAVGKLISNCL